MLLPSCDPQWEECAVPMADAISQSLANSLAGNHPAWAAIFGSGSFASRMTQNLLDDTFSKEEE